MTRYAMSAPIVDALTPKFLQSMATSTAPADVRKFFAYTMLELLNTILRETNEEFDLFYEDVALAPETVTGYALSTRLAGYPPFATLFNESDLSVSIQHFADLARARYTALATTPR